MPCNCPLHRQFGTSALMVAAKPDDHERHVAAPPGLCTMKRS
jgi:hypothetical protein